MTYMILDCLMILALSLMAYYCYHLHKRITTLKQTTNNLVPVLKQLGGTLSTAHIILERFRNASNDVNKNLVPKIQEGSKIRDDLAYLTEYAEKLAENLMENIETAKGVSVSAVTRQTMMEKNNKVEVFEEKNPEIEAMPEKVKTLDDSSQEVEKNSQYHKHRLGGLLERLSNAG